MVDRRGRPGKPRKNQIHSLVQKRRRLSNISIIHIEGRKHRSKEVKKLRKSLFKSFLEKLTFNEWLTLFLGFVGIFISLASFYNSITSKDNSNAIVELKDMATAENNVASRQGDATSVMVGQLSAMGSEVSTLEAENKISSDQLAVSKDTAHRQLISYVMVDPGIITWSNGKTPITVYATLTDVGQTPAYDITEYMFEAIRPTNTKICPVGRVIPYRNKLILGPGRDISYLRQPDDTNKDYVVTVSDDAEKDIISGKSSVFVSGFVTYRDVYNEYWRKDYCFFYSGPTWKERGAYFSQGNGTSQIDSDVTVKGILKGYLPLQ